MHAKRMRAASNLSGRLLTKTFESFDCARSAAAFSPQGFAQLDAASYGGFDSYATVGASGWNPRFASLLASDAPGVYHVLARLRTAQIAGNLPSISLHFVPIQRLCLS